MAFHYPIGGGSGGGGVTSLNTLTGALNLVEGAGIDITTSGSDITIAAIGANVSNDTSLAVKVATTAALPGTPTYNNGTAGVGATLTRSSNGTTGTIDGVTAANLMVGDYILVKNQAAQLQNGVYSVTQQGTASLPYILTRVTEADTTAELDDLVVTAASGTTNKGVPYGQQTNNPTIGTNNIVFTATGIYVKQQSSGTQAAGQIPYYSSAAMTITKGDSLFTRDSVTKDTNILKTTGTETIGYKVIDNLYSTFTGAGTTYLNTATYTFGLSGILINGGNPVYQTLLQYGSGGADGFASVAASNEGITHFASEGVTSLDTSVELSGSIADKLLGLTLAASGYNNTLQLGDGTLIVDLPHTQQSAVSFTGSGLDDLILAGTFTGTVPTTYTVTIDGVNKTVFNVDLDDIVGGSFAVGQTITTGANTATIDGLMPNPLGNHLFMTVTITSGSFNPTDIIDNGSGVTAPINTIQTRDTFSVDDGTTVTPFVPIFFDVLFVIVLGSETGHTLSDSWTWDYTTVNQNVLDFSNNDYKFQSVLGTDTFGYQIGDNLFGVGLKGALNTYSNLAGDIGLSGINNTQQLQIIDQLSFADGNSTTQSLLKNQYDIEVNNSTESSVIGMKATTFGVSSFLSSGEHGISQSAGVFTIGNLYGGNGTKITIDDINEHITIGNLPAYDDDAAAGTAGLIAGMVYMTTGSGSAPLNVSGILMIKQ